MSNLEPLTSECFSVSTCVWCQKIHFSSLVVQIIGHLAHHFPRSVTVTFCLLLLHSGGTQRLPRLVGISKAKEMIFTGKMISGTEAAEIGLADYAVEQNEAGDAAYQRALILAEEILPRGPVAVKMAKLAINKGVQVSLILAWWLEGRYISPHICCLAPFF